MHCKGIFECVNAARYYFVINVFPFRLLRSDKLFFRITNQVESDLMVVQQISIQHHKLCTICNKLNNTYSFQLLLIILQAFITIIAVSFYLASYVISSGVHMKNVFELAYYTNLLILYNLTVIILVVNCSSTARQVISKILVSPPDIFLPGSEDWKLSESDIVTIFRNSHQGFHRCGGKYPIERQPNGSLY